MDVNFTPFTIVLFVVLCALLPLWILKRRKTYSPPLPPTPWFQLPLFGHFHLFTKDARIFLRKLRSRYGEVYRLQLGNMPVVVISGYDAIKEAFKTNGDKFPMRPHLPLLDKMTRNMGVGMTNGPAWLEHRRFTLKTLRDFGMGRSKLETKIHSEIGELFSEIESHQQQPFDPNLYLTTHVSNIICTMAFGVSFKHSDPRYRDFLKRFEENLHSLVGVANFLPWLEYIPVDLVGMKRALENSDAIFDYCETIVREHLDSYDEENIYDLTSAYIREVKRLENTKEETTMSYEFLAAVIADLFIAGSETTSTALRWSLALLAIHPDIQEEMFCQVDKHVGSSRLPTLQDKVALKYVEAFYMEVLRYTNLTLFGLLHCSNKEVVLRGFTVPAGMSVMPDLDSVFTDAKVWGDPQVFRPDRFIDEHGNLEKREEFLAFFTGKRSCLGESLARMELLLFLSCLVQRFKFECADDEPLSMEVIDGEFGSTHTPKPYKIVARRR